MYVNMMCPTCKVEVSANVAPERVFPTDGYDKREAYCLKCQKPVPIWVSVDLVEPQPPEPEKGIRLSDDPNVARKQMTEIAASMGFWLAWRKK